MLIVLNIIVPEICPYVRDKMYNSFMILNVYKPKGFTSFDVVAKARKQLHIKKVGHAGTLDPLAKGMLIILTEKDTKKQNTFMNMDKEYEAEIGFGIYSETYDLEFLPRFTKKITLKSIKENINNILKSFIGTQKQVVPIYSAVSVKGQRLYKLARKGKTVENIPSKEITIYDIELIDQFETTLQTNLGKRIVPAIKIKVKCSSGTYIRALARDIGKALGTDAIVLKLVRTRIGDFKATDSLQLSELK
jgi:tRNA pseudouridine55 synthase